MTETDIKSGKLMLLYMLKQVRSIPSLDLQAWAIESLFLDYFLFMQAKEELKRDHMMIEAVRKGETRCDASGRPVELCDITPEGELVLNPLIASIPTHIQAYFSNTAQKWSRKARQDRSVLASFSPDANGAFLVRLSLFDGANTTVDLTLSAPDTATAKKICRRWKESTADIYRSLLISLTDESKDHT
jgi:hypothetical protein